LPYASPPQGHKPLPRPSDVVPPSSPPRKRRAIEQTPSRKPSLAPIETGSTLRRPSGTYDLGSSYQEAHLTKGHSDYSPPYTSGTSPRRRQDSVYSSATTIPQPPPSAMFSSRLSENPPYAMLPPPPLTSPIRADSVHTRRYSYQQQAPAYSPEHSYSGRPASQGATLMQSPRSASSLPPPPRIHSRPSPILHYMPGPRSATEYRERPSLSPGYELGEPSLLPLAHLNRETTPVQTTLIPSPTSLSLPPPTSMSTAPRNPRDSEILSAFDTLSDSPSRPGVKRKRTPTPPDQPGK